MRGAVVLAVCAVVLALWPEPREVRGSLQVAPLLPEGDARPVAGISLVLPDRPELLYLRSAGRWRCATALGAPVLEAEVQRLVADLRSARGLVRALADETLATPSASAKLSLHGPGLMEDAARDRLVSIDLAPLGERTLARVAGGPWLELPGDLAARLAWPASATLPPLLDDHLVACAWPEGFPGLARVFIDVTDGPSLELRPAAGGEGWIAAQGDEQRAVLPYRLAGYVNYLVRARYVGLGDGRRPEEFGLTPPRARVTLEPSTGPPVEITVGRPTALGTFVALRSPAFVGQVQEQDASWLAPDMDMLTDATRANPWESWLVR